MRLIAVAGLMLLTSCSVAAQSGSGCSPDDDTGVGFLNEFVRLLAETDPELVDARTRFYNVPSVLPSAVTPVRDAATLGRARAGLARHIKQGPSRCIYVLRLGDSHFAVFDPGYRVGHYDAVFIFDRDWRHVGGWTG